MICVLTLFIQEIKTGGELRRTNENEIKIVD